MRNGVKKGCQIHDKVSKQAELPFKTPKTPRANFILTNQQESGCKNEMFEIKC
jgi:hypothetical protein